MAGLRSFGRASGIVRLRFLWRASGWQGCTRHGQRLSVDRIAGGGSRPAPPVLQLHAINQPPLRSMDAALVSATRANDGCRNLVEVWVPQCERQWMTRDAARVQAEALNLRQPLVERPGIRA